MRKTIFPVLIYCLSQFEFTTAEEPQTTTGDHNCPLERWSDNSNIKVYNYLGKVRKILRFYILYRRPNRDNDFRLVLGMFV